VKLHPCSVAGFSNCSSAFDVLLLWLRQCAREDTSITMKKPQADGQRLSRFFIWIVK
jgi:hypothetical protein